MLLALLVLCATGVNRALAALAYRIEELEAGGSGGSAAFRRCAVANPEPIPLLLLRIQVLTFAHCHSVHMLVQVWLIFSYTLQTISAGCCLSLLPPSK